MGKKEDRESEEEDRRVASQECDYKNGLGNAITFDSEWEVEGGGGG